MIGSECHSPIGKGGHPVMEANVFEDLLGVLAEEHSTLALQKKVS